MEIITGILICGKLIATALAAYFYADARADKRFIAKQSEWLEVERKEKLEWAAKALAKQGSKPLFHATPEKKDDPSPQRRVVTRTEAASRVQETIDKAKDIVK